MHSRLGWIIAAIVSMVSPAQGEVKLPPIFSDHLVLQADRAVPVWGTASAGENVTVNLNGKPKHAMADASGNWRVDLDSAKSGGPFELKISGINSITIKDVLVGEVWLASGQSNMRFPISKVTDS